jgi:CBS domain-containing protein
MTTKATNHRTSVSALMGRPLKDAQGVVFGHVREFAVDPAKDTGHVAALLLRRTGAGRADSPTMVNVEALELEAPESLKLRAGAVTEIVTDSEQFLLLERDLLDQQIIDVHGHKVVRVNDVDLVWEAAGSGEHPATMKLRIAEVEVGVRGAARRLLKGLPQAMIDRIGMQFRPRVIPWDFVDLIDRDPARRVKLKIEQNRLASMHPSDIADILEDLAPAEREALFTSLDEEIAAEALEEVDPKLQKALLEGMNSERAADIIEEMDPAAAADLLSGLADERSEAILGEMDPQDRHDVQELLEFPPDSAAGQMTTDCVSLEPDASVRQAIAAINDFEGDPDTLAEIYLTDADEILKGMVPMVRLLTAHPDALLQSLAASHVSHCSLDTSVKEVAELFDKYNLRSLAVLNEKRRLAGVIHAEQVIGMLRAQQ